MNACWRNPASLACTPSTLKRHQETTPRPWWHAGTTQAGGRGGGGGAKSGRGVLRGSPVRQLVRYWPAARHCASRGSPGRDHLLFHASMLRQRDRPACRAPRGHIWSRQPLPCNPWLVLTRSQPQTARRPAIVPSSCTLAPSSQFQAPARHPAAPTARQATQRQVCARDNPALGPAATWRARQAARRVPTWPQRPWPRRGALRAAVAARPASPLPASTPGALPAPRGPLQSLCGRGSRRPRLTRHCPLPNSAGRSSWT